MVRSSLLGALALAALCGAPLATQAGAGPACPDGLGPVDLLRGDVGPAPAGTAEHVACLEVRNDRDFERAEVAFSSIPIPREAALTGVDGLVVVGPGERRLAAQLDVISRWGSPVDDARAPIRWLQVATAARVAAGGESRYALRRYAEAPAADDAFSASIASTGDQHVVETGLATFVLDAANPALLESIALATDDTGAGRTTVYSDSLLAGPRLVFAGPAGDVDLDRRQPGAVTVDPGGFRIIERGPVKVVVAMRGHLNAAGGESLCAPDGVTPYERFGYTLIATFARGSRDVDLQVQFRNECSDGFAGPWTDDIITVRRFSWELPLSLDEPAAWYAGGGAPATAAAAEIVVAQGRGGGTPWERRARVSIYGAAAENAEAFSQPIVALVDPAWIAAAQMPWMRFREPQAIAASGEALSLRFVGDTLIVGEGKGIWGYARVGFRPAGGTATALESIRAQGTAALERGLLVRVPLDELNHARLFPSFGSGRPSRIEAAYRSLLELVHEETVDPDPVRGQWPRAKTFGSQLWPDVQFDLYLIDNDAPENNSGAMNYWDPAGAELLEFMRTGDPAWVWDFALPQGWLQMFTAYLNIGEQDHGNRAGHAVTSGGTGEGQWHRSAFGSDDYSYNMGMELVYALRPNVALRDRFGQAGWTVVRRYSIPREDEEQREEFVNQVDIVRQVIQHFEMLANCAEFVPGQRGADCDAKLGEVVDELARDNLRAGVMCQGDTPSDTMCYTPQQFMQNALMYPFFHRVFLNYGEPPAGGLGRALVEAPLRLYEFGLEKQADGVSLVPTGDWAAAMSCELAAGGTRVTSCRPERDSDDNFFMFSPTRPHTAALLLMADELDPSLGLCDIVRDVYDDPAHSDGWYEFIGNDSGWWKGSAQMMQSMAFGVGRYDACALPEPGQGALAGAAVLTLATCARSRGARRRRGGTR